MDPQEQANDRPYPRCSAISRTIRVGGMTKHELLAQLRDAKVQLNEYAHVLFAHTKFTTSPTASQVETVELSVADLGCSDGANIGHMHERAAACGLSLCPLDLAPHFRLQYLDQPEGHIGHPPSQHRAPPGSLTVASRELTSDDATPKGFYLRRIEGVLWLRGYCSGPDHGWSPTDRLVFCRQELTA
jgi:hypothetical protein